MEAGFVVVVLELDVGVNCWLGFVLFAAGALEASAGGLLNTWGL